MSRPIAERLADLHYRPSDRVEAMECTEICSDMLHTLEKTHDLLMRLALSPESPSLNRVRDTIEKAGGKL